MNFNFEAPFNPLSLGQVSMGIAYEFFKRGISPNIFPISQADIGVYDKVGEDFKVYLQACVNKSVNHFKSNIPYLKCWHINGSIHKISKPASLLTFHETDTLTETEINILNSYEKIFVTSNFSKDVFESHGVTTPVVYVPLGFDSIHCKNTNKKAYDPNTIVFSIFGKLESRKAHKQAIQGWVKKFGNNNQYRLHCHTHNVFYKPEDLNRAYVDIFGGQKPFNVEIFGFQPSNTLQNDCYNATDIVIDLSGGESISIPSMTCVALGKIGVIHKNSGMEWATDENSIIINSNGKRPCIDNIFFHPNQPYNQGNFFTCSDEDYANALDKAVAKFKTNKLNEAGLKLQKDYSYEKGVDIILKELNN